MRPLVHQFLEHRAKKSPQKKALFCDDKSYSYGEMNAAAESVASLLSKETKFQDRVILFLSNSFEYVACYFGILKAGRVAVPFDPSINMALLKERADFCGAKLCLSSGALLKTVEKGNVKGLRIFEAEDVLAYSVGWTERQKIAPHDLASILFTTGTTGAAKGVMVKHRNICSATENILKILKYSERSIDINALPLTHSFGLGNVHSVFAAGGSVLLYKNFINLKKILDDTKKFKATSFSATPPIFDSMARPLSSLFKKSGQSLRLLLSNSAPIPPPTIEKILKLLPHADFFTYYGLTEASRSTFINYRKEKRFTSVGQSAPRVKVAVKSESGRLLKSGTIGEVCIKGPTVVDGYWKNEKETKKRIKNGWLQSGDNGYLDEEGYLFLTGRNDDIINIGGKKVYPFEIEDVIKRYKGIEDVAVVSMPDPWLGEAPRAVVVYRGSADSLRLRDNIKKFCAKHLEPFKVPKSIDFIDSLPKTSSGKLQKKVLRSQT